MAWQYMAIIIVLIIHTCIAIITSISDSRRTMGWSIPKFILCVAEGIFVGYLAIWLIINYPR